MKKLYFGGTVLTMEKEMTAEAVLTDDGIITMTGKEGRSSSGGKGCGKDRS
jgi:predicted amidohydrolase YtcJ